jgi:hypothetical protein
MAMGQILNDTALLTVSKREFKRFDFTASAWRFTQGVEPPISCVNLMVALGKETSDKKNEVM